MQRGEHGFQPSCWSPGLKKPQTSLLVSVHLPAPRLLRGHRTSKVRAEGLGISVLSFSRGSPSPARQLARKRPPAPVAAWSQGRGLREDEPGSGASSPRSSPPHLLRVRRRRARGAVLDETCPRWWLPVCPGPDGAGAPRTVPRPPNQFSARGSGTRTLRGAIAAAAKGPRDSLLPFHQVLFADVAASADLNHKRSSLSRSSARCPDRRGGGSGTRSGCAEAAGRCPRAWEHRGPRRIRAGNSLGETGAGPARRSKAAEA
ncbi:uncharacterized protein LOC124243798 [Equus quagga]|uniref:uncharacterized protein LOC124243798 n=1 Tax=Equus quagga TaxID=89248 RepID=UPI001EE28E4C|nr:uncharacterized protein LOC124243798 [Equus quagga]